ncbi:MAG: alkaline phosphatase, partial [Bacteroidetes bacterium]
MIGDGMGIAQITAALYRNGDHLNLEKFPVVGLHKSYSASNLITDSAAGATAFATGIKTYNGAIGVNPDTLPVKTILEMAEDHGLATGLVATSSIVHATPASFVAHQKLRKMYEAIALDFLKT